MNGTIASPKHIADGLLARADAARRATGIKNVALPLHNAELAMSRADDLSARVIALADRLIGAVPETSGDGIQDMPAGVLPQLSRKADAAISSINKAFAALDRLEGQL